MFCTIFNFQTRSRMSDTSYAYNDGYYVTEDKTFNSEKEYYTKSENGYSKISDDVTEFEKDVTYYEYFEMYDESDLQLTISGLTDMEYITDYRKSGDMIYCESAVAKYGWKGATYNNTDLTVKENLILKGIIELKSMISPKRTIEVKAIDMHVINPDIKPIRIGEYVRVRSEPHNLDSYFLCTSIDLDLTNPENSVYTFGTTFDTLTGQQNKRIKTLNKSINSTYEKAEKLTDKEKQNSLMAGEALKKSVSAEKKADAAVINVYDEYAISNSQTEPPTIGWSTETPGIEEGKYAWRRVVTVYGDGHKEIGVPSLLTGSNGKDGEDGIVLKITSSKGTMFKNDNIQTVLSVSINKGSSRITTIEGLQQAFGESAHLQWGYQRSNDDTFTTMSNDDSRFSNNGFTFTVSPNDFDNKVSFSCDLVR